MDKNFRSCFCCVHFLEIQNTSIGNVLKCKKGSSTKVQGKRLTEKPQDAKTLKRESHVKEHSKTKLRIKVIVARVFEKEKNVKSLK